jgi:hypothetical protein
VYLHYDLEGANITPFEDLSVFQHMHGVNKCSFQYSPVSQGGIVVQILPHKFKIYCYANLLGDTTPHSLPSLSISSNSNSCDDVFYRRM